MAKNSLLKLIFKNPKKVLPQLLIAVCASMGFFSTGAVRGWSSPGVPSLKESKDIPLSEQDLAWIASLPPLCALFGSLLCGIPLQMLGRRRTLMLIGIPFFVGFIVLGSSTNAVSLYAGRILSGTMNGATTPAAQIYVSECSSPRVRGTLGSVTATFLALGVLVAYVIGAFTKWDELAYILSAFPCILTISMFFMPETPSWLISKGRIEEAKQSLQRLRGQHTNVDIEFERIKQNVEKATKQDNIKPKDLIKGSVWKPLVVSMGLMFFQQFSGINVVIYYTVSIFQSAGSTIDRKIATIIVGIVQVVCTATAAFLVDRFGRRMLLFISGTGMAISLTSMGIFFYLKSVWATGEAEATLGWLPLTSLIVFVIAYSAGYSNVPFLIMGELFPTRFRNLLGSISSCFNLMCTFVVVRTFPEMNKGMGQHGSFWFFAACCVASLFFVFFMLPETKGKTLEEIERMFTAKNKMNNNTPDVQHAEDGGKKSNSRRNSITLAATVATTAAAATFSVSHPGQIPIYHENSEDEEWDEDEVPVATPM